MWQKDAVYWDFCTPNYILKYIPYVPPYWLQKVNTKKDLVAGSQEAKSSSCVLEPILSHPALILSMLYDVPLRQSKRGRGKESLFLYSKYCFNKTESLFLSL